MERDPKFGERVCNPGASHDNPFRSGIFVRKVIRRSRLNPGVWYEITDGLGEFWLIPRDTAAIISADEVAAHEH